MKPHSTLASGRQTFAPTVVGVLLAVGLVAGANCHGGADDEARLRFLSEGFAANLEAFEFYTCEMRVRQGKCSSVERGVKQGPESDIVDATSVVTIDGDLLCWRRHSNSQYRPSGTPRMMSAVLEPQGQLADGQKWLSAFYLGGGGGTVGTKPPPEYGPEATTWNSAGTIRSGFDGTFSAIAQSYFSDPAGSILSVEEERGASRPPTSRVEIKYGAGGADAMVFQVDEAQGFIPVRVDGTIQGKVFTKSFVTEIKKCSRDRWFPMRCVGIWFNHLEEGGDHTVREVVVTRLDVDRRPRREQFYLDLPGGMVVNDGEKNAAFVVTSADEKVTLDDLESLYQRTQDSFGARQAQKGRGRTGMWFLAGGAVVLAMLLAAWVAQRARA